MLRKLLSAAWWGLIAALTVWAHGGGVDDGGHRDRRTGEYHFHEGPHEGRCFDDKAAGLRALRGAGGAAGQPQAQPAAAAAPLRGTIVYVTPSGKKYHQPRCSFLKKTRQKISLSAAKKAGLTACNRCRRR